MSMTRPHTMTSKSLAEKKFLDPDCDRSKDLGTKPKKRHSTVYDAVAGRVTANGFITSEPSYSVLRDISSTSRSAVPPESVLFRRKGAPTRYEESDVYFAKDAPILPDSDMLKALHAYASDFYACALPRRGRGSLKSLDETALLALGLLIEEVAKDSLGETGDFAFTEGEAVTDTTTNSRNTSQTPTANKSNRIEKTKQRSATRRFSLKD